MQETKTIWYSGRFVPFSKAQTHVLTHALNYGTGIFEGIRCYPLGRAKDRLGGALFRLDDHIDRFYNSAQALAMRMPFSKKNFRRAIIETVKKNKIYDVYVRPLAFYGYQKIGPNPADSPVEIIIACIPLQGYLKKDFIRVQTSRFRRIPPISCLPHTKISGMYFNSALATIEAARKGADEAIVYDFKGFIAEGAAENIFIVKKGVLSTPPKDTILPGITRETIFILAKDLGIRCREKRITLGELQTADEAFFTGTAVEVHSIGYVNGVQLPRKNPITRKLAEYYQNVVHGKIPKYKKWLTKTV